MSRLRGYKLCPECGQPMLKKGHKRKHPDDYRHASCCPLDDAEDSLNNWNIDNRIAFTKRLVAAGWTKKDAEREYDQIQQDKESEL